MTGDIQAPAHDQISTNAPPTEPRKTPRGPIRSLFYSLRISADIRDLESVIELLPLREVALRIAEEGLGRVDAHLTPDERFKLAATDLFVEKAQYVLGRRARVLFFSGALAVTLSVGLLIASVNIVR